ncbi:MAG TPA: GNAT family N-acetyltransferase [Casimicrobiaceae bacterium]|nr:GNAT family N-acetyltransferase [Casimicrobiaceae bacterium]
MRIRVAPPDFCAWPELLALLRGAFAYMESRIDPPSSLNDMGVDALREKAKEEILFVATEGTELVGCAFAALREDCVYVGKLAVADTARRRGVARALLAATEGIARDNLRPFLELQTRVELSENHEAFAALGFEKVAETAHPGYDRPTSITMRKRVSQSAG